MKKRIFLILALLSFCSLALSQEDNKDEILPPGMEKIKVGRGSEVIVPEGTKTHKVGDLVVLENPGEYMARRMNELDGRLAQFEEENRLLRRRIEKLEAQIAEMHKALLRLEGKADK